MYIFALYLLIHKLMKQTKLKYLMIGVLTIAKIIVSFLTFTIKIPLNTRLTAACSKRT